MKTDRQDGPGDHVRPDNVLLFRLARLLLLLGEASTVKSRHPLDLERIGYYDFFSASPFLILDVDDKDGRRLLLEGFDAQNLSYLSSAQRFTNRRAKLQHDLSQLVAMGLAAAAVENERVAYEVTPIGQRLACSLTSLYARSFRASSRLIVSRLGRLSDSRLRNEAKEWLKSEPFLIDIYDAEEGLAQ